MPRDLGIADRLRALGVPTVECDGWQTRGSESFSPAGSVNHHTAGPASGSAPSLGTVINGRPDLAGPLANVLQSREPDGRDVAYVVAAGRANHAGEGGWWGLSGNSSVYGLEIEHTGTEPLPAGRQEVAARIHAAMFGGDPAMVCQHSEWTTRKIDAATDVDPDRFRQLVATAAAPAPPEPEPEEADMAGYPYIVQHANGMHYYVTPNGGGQILDGRTTENFRAAGFAVVDVTHSMPDSDMVLAVEAVPAAVDDVGE